MLQKRQRWYLTIMVVLMIVVTIGEATPKPLGYDLQSKLERFLDDYYRSGEINDIGYGLTFYARNVKYYFGRHDLSRTQISRDKRRYFRKWPIRHYRLLDWRVIAFDGNAYNGNIIVDTRFFWSVARGSRKKTGQGQGQIDLEIRNGRFLITAVGDPHPSMRKVRRIAYRSAPSGDGAMEIYEERRPDFSPHNYFLHYAGQFGAWWVRLPDDFLIQADGRFSRNDLFILHASAEVLSSRRSYLIDLSQRWISTLPGNVQSNGPDRFISRETWHFPQGGYVWLRTLRNADGELLAFPDTLPPDTPCQRPATIRWGSTLPGCMRVRDLLKGHTVGPRFQQNPETKIRYETD